MCLTQNYLNENHSIIKGEGRNADRQIQMKYYSLLGPSLASTSNPFSSYSALVIQNSSLSFITSARTAPPMKTMSFLLGGSSILILNLESLSVSPLRTRSRYNCLISLSSLLGSPGYIVDPPDNTICLYSSGLISISPAWMAENTNSAIPCPSLLMRCG